jgi:glycosyltransferase involved in cell wall biosynthesis
LPVRVVSVITRLARGGSERRLYDVLRAVPADHTVVVGADSDPTVVGRLATDHEVIECPELVRPVGVFRDPRALAWLVSILRSRSADVVHTHQSKAGLLGRVAARGARVRTIYHSASMASFGPGYGAAESRMFAVAERATAPLVSRYFVVGTDLVERLAANGIARRRLEVVRSSLDLRAFVPPSADEQAALRARFGVEPGTRVVCYVGSLEERKGVTSLPEIVSAAAGSQPVSLLVAGAGPAYAELAARASDPGLGIGLQVLGYVNDVAEVMRASDLLVLPSSAEGLPQVLVQAASCGLPFTAYDVDGVRELLALGAVGRVVPVGDRPGLTSSVASALAATRGADRSAAVDPAVWAAWDPEVVAGQYRAAYEQDLGCRLGPGRQDRLRE